MADKRISELTSASLPLEGTEEIAIVQSGVTKKTSVNNISGGKKYHYIEFPLSGGSTNTTNWWHLQSTTSTLYNTGYGNNTLDYSTDFSDLTTETLSRIVPFECKIKSIKLQGRTNIGNMPNVDFVILKSKQTTNINTIQNSKIVAEKNVTSLDIPSSNLFKIEFLESEIEDYIIDDFSELRVLFNNNNSAVNFLNASLVVELESVG